MIRCPHCATENEAGSLACSHCGVAFSAATSAPPDRAAEGPAPQHAELDLGSTLGGRYRLVARLGRGAMGEVFRADDLRLGQVVALKFLPPEVAGNAAVLQRFYAEVRLGRQVSHPNVCRLHDLVEIDGRHCLSMEFIDGEDLSSRLERGGPLDKAELHMLAVDLCAALAAAHEKGVIHRDLKPANILLDPEGHAHIADFGIASLAESVDGHELAGTLAYMAPELIEGVPASAASDLYALGLVLYEAAIGRRRFTARNLAELKQQHAQAGAVDLDEAKARLSPALRGVIVDCLQREPAARPRSARELLARLQPPAPAAQPRTLRRWLPAIVVLATVALLSAALYERGGFGQPAPTAVARLGPASAAVLPFVNLSGDKRNEYFSDGMADTLLDRLAQVPQLKIAARTSSFSFKGKNADIATIGSALGVAAIVEGSVQQEGDTLRITAQLIRVADGSHLWSRHYDRKAQDLFAIQDEIASAVTNALVGQLLPSSKRALAKRGTEDLEAYRDYIRGHQALNRLSMESFLEAEKLLRRAVERDPRYVVAMLDLVQAWGWLYESGAFGQEEFQKRATPMLDRVEALDPGNARVLSLRGWLAQSRGEFDLATRLVERAVAAGPNDIGIRMNAAGVYLHKADYPAALRHLDRMVALDPLDAYGYAQRASALEVLGKLDEAEVQARKAMSLDPGHLVALSTLANIAVDRHDLLHGLLWAMKVYQHNVDPSLAVQLAMNLDGIGDRAAADAWMARSLAQQPTDNHLAEAYSVSRRYQAGDDAGAIALAKSMLSRMGAHWEGRWDEAIQSACFAAQRSGRLAEMRETITAAGLMPPRFDVATLRAWAGAGPDARDKLLELAYFGPCSFEQTAADAARRSALLQVLQPFPRPRTALPDYEQLLSARLRSDREAMVAYVVAPQDYPVWLVAALARMCDVADDPRVPVRLRQLKSEYAKVQAELPALLAREQLSIWPPPQPGKAAGATAP